MLQVPQWFVCCRSLGDLAQHQRLAQASFFFAQSFDFGDHIRDNVFGYGITVAAALKGRPANAEWRRVTMSRPCSQSFSG